MLRRPNIGPAVDALGNPNPDFPFSFNEIRVYQVPNLIATLAGTVTINGQTNALLASWANLDRLITTPSVGNMKYGEPPVTGKGTTGTE